MQKSIIFSSAVIAALIVAPPIAPAADQSDIHSVCDFGARGDGKTDDTAAFQKALDTVAQAGGGVVYAPRGNYFFSGHLNIPSAVTLKGVWESVPAHNGIRDAGLPWKREIYPPPDWEAFKKLGS